jgi:hypothetical protein
MGGFGKVQFPLPVLRERVRAIRQNCRADCQSAETHEQPAASRRQVGDLPYDVLSRSTGSGQRLFENAASAMRFKARGRPSPWLSDR